MIFNFIDINCECEFSNQGGGYSEVVFVEDTLTELEIDALVYAHLVSRTGYSELNDDDYSWSYVTLTEFVKE